jgi:quercetin dioxygenase-like cupin family protein
MNRKAIGGTSMTTPKPRKRTRLTLGLIAGVVGLLGVGISSVGAASSLPQVDPATVPQGELALESRAQTPFSLDVGGHEINFHHGAEVTVEHDQFPAGTTTGWHAHAGPIFVEVVSGTLTLYKANDEKCKGAKVAAGSGFVEPPLVVHDARNETSGNVDIYVTYVLPPGSGDNGLFIPKPDHFNPDCPFAN